MGFKSAADEAFQRGSISPSQMKKLSKQTGNIQNSRMADFDDKSGKSDQGAGKTRGVAQTTSRSINTNQSLGSAELASGRPNSSATSKGQPSSDAIDQQRGGKFPTGAKVKASNKQANLKASNKKVAREGGQYGGGGRNTQ